MKILITGASGFVGKALVSALIKKGAKLVLLSRNPHTLKPIYGDMLDYYAWDALIGPPPSEAFEGVTAIVNLMGEGIADKRWTKKQKEKIRNSRVGGTQYLMKAANTHAPLLETVVSTSAIGYYDHGTPASVIETSPRAHDFLGKLCQEWEEATKPLSEKVRLSIIRTGIVLGDGGALAKMKGPFLWGVGGKLGSGQQWMNWIHIQDLVNIYVTALYANEFQGVYNAVSPNNVTNSMFTQALGQVLFRPTLFSVPRFVIKLLLGELSQEVLRGAKVTPKRLLNQAFTFQFADIRDALENALHIKYIDHLGKKIRCNRFHRGQFIPYKKEQTFSFFSDASNLEQITPPFLKFKITSQSTTNIQKGTLLTYKLKVHGIPLRWKTLICDWSHNNYFIDTQLKGPFRVWHHTHRFTAYGKGTWMEDEVYYAIPNIPIASFFATPFVKKDTSSIFGYREKTLLSILKQTFTK